MYCVILIVGAVQLATAEHLPDTECNHKVSECGSHRNGIDVSGDYGINDYTSMLQVFQAVDRTHGRTATPSKVDASKAASGTGTVEMASETIAVLGRAGDASFHRLRTSFQTKFQTWCEGLMKQMQMKPPYSTFDFAVALFVLASVTTSFITCTLLAVRGKASRHSRPRRCSALSRLLCMKVQPDTVDQVNRPLPAFHPAVSQHCQGQQPPRAPTYYVRETKLKEVTGLQQPRLSAEQILAEACRKAAEATKVTKEHNAYAPRELKSFVDMDH